MTCVKKQKEAEQTDLNGIEVKRKLFNEFQVCLCAQEFRKFLSPFTFL